MKTIIAGSRGITDYSTLEAAVASAGWKPTAIISGGAQGVDLLGERWAKEHDIPVERYTAEWDKYGRSAGYKRNQLMAAKADALIAVWDGKSHGTNHMIFVARDKGLCVIVWKTQ